MRNSPTAQWWKYPLSSPSYRFTQQNNLVRQLAVRYAALLPVEKTAWEIAAENWFWFAQCVPWVYDYDPTEFVQPTGELAYRGVNTTNVTIGLDVSDTPPLTATAIDGDTITQVGSVPTTIVWGGRSSFPSGDYVAQLRVCALNHEPESGPSLKKYTWDGVKPINYGTNLDVSDVFASTKGYSALPFVSLAVSITLKSNAPFVGRRVPFTAPY